MSFLLSEHRGNQLVFYVSNFSATQLITQVGLPLSDLSQCPQLDVAFDGADECDRNLDCIKGEMFISIVDTVCAF